MITIILIALLGYVLPAFLMWLYMSLIYFHPEGKLNHLKPDSMDLFVVSSPVLNIFFCIVFWFFDWPLGKIKKDTSSFFYRNWKR